MFQIDHYQIPKSGKIQSLQLQGHVLSVCDSSHQREMIDVFAAYDRKAEHTERAFKVYRTNQFVPNAAEFVDTIVDAHDGVAYHIFDVSDVPMKELDLK